MGKHTICLPHALCISLKVKVDVRDHGYMDTWINIEMKKRQGLLSRLGAWVSREGVEVEKTGELNKNN